MKKLLFPLFAYAMTIGLFSCKKSKDDNTSCTLQVLKSPTGQNQTLSANIDNSGYTNIDAQTLLADGGTPLRNYTWSIESSPTPPSGYIFWPQTGIIYRTGTTASGLTTGKKTFNVKVSDGSCTATGTVDLAVTNYTPGPSAILQQLSSNFQLKNGDAGKEYGASLFVMGGTPPYSWKLDATYAGSTDLTNAGLQVEAAGGIVRGKLLTTSSGKTIKFRVTVTDNDGSTAAYSPIYTIKVN